MVIGAGPTALGLAYRFHELDRPQCDMEIIILEQERKPGGLAMSHRDNVGFTWDNGGHVVFSHYKYFNRALDNALSDWNMKKRAAFAFMMGSSGSRKFIPYPVQDNLHLMDQVEQEYALRGLEKAVNSSKKSKPVNFDEWLLQNFGDGLCQIFMRRYNRKVWTVNTTEMNAVWVGERVAVPDINKIKNNIKHGMKNVHDSAWGPNRLFRFPKYGGTGGLWIAMSKLLPRHWFHYKLVVKSVDFIKKRVEVENCQGHKRLLNYDILVSTMPLNLLVEMNNSTNRPSLNMKKHVKDLVYSHTHIVGIGLFGKAPKQLSDKSWIYFPDSDSPFYRVTVFSNYSDDHVPTPGKYWSLMCEVAEPKNSQDSRYDKQAIVEDTVDALVLYKFLTKQQIVSTFYHRLPYGYPVPSLSRDFILSEVQPWLQSMDIYSRGRFGGWKYEVGNQDHSFMQGVELADLLVRGISEETYWHPDIVNNMRATDRILFRT